MLRNTAVFTLWLLLVFTVPCIAGDFVLLHQFDGINGAVPYGSVICDNGKLYGTTVKTNSTSTLGTVYSLNINGSGFSVLKSFTDSAEGEQVYNGLTLYNDSLYGITRIGGTDNKGTLFKVGIDGNGFEVVHNFIGGTDGQNPYTSPILYNGKLYGMTYSGGSGAGCIYSYDPSNSQTQTLHSFSSPGDNPFGTLIPVGEWLYGMTSDHRDTNNHGNIFRYNPSGNTYEVLHSFSGGTSGGYPYDSLVWDGGNYLYGTTLGYYPFTGETAPLSDEGVVFRYNISMDEYSVIHDFSAQSWDGAKPNSSMLIGEDGWLYGIAHGNEIWGGTEFGTLYRMQPDGSNFEVLHTFNSTENGDVPMRSLVWQDGVIYGTTAYGGQGDGDGYGTVWSYNTVPEPSTGIMLSAVFLWLIQKRNKPLAV